ncbi:MAG: polyprenyl synthetase family protein [Bacteroidia bacterium]
MHSLKELQALVQQEIDSLQIKTSPHDLYEPIRYSMSLSAKRIRPALVLLGCELFGGDARKAVKASIGIELFHNFTLLHDDIMDNAPLRRNQPTVHTKWNSNVAILSGDAMFTKAFQQMMMVDDEVMRPVLNLFSETALSVCEGQQLDMDYEKVLNIKIEDYLNMITLKTAVLLAASLKTGALIAKTNDENAIHIYEYGKNLGIAFQLQDDILDVYADPEKFGKQIGGDIIANKKTYLLLTALYKANIDQYEALSELLNDRKERFLPYEKVNRITTIYDELGVKEITETEVNKYYNEALKHLNKIEISDENKKVLREFGAHLMKREL